jgi:beta-1,4-N-acetylglucosaminyltransferase
LPVADSSVAEAIPLKICVVASCGGHLTQARSLSPAYAEYPHFFVVTPEIALPPDMVGKTYFVSHAERDWKILLNFYEAFRILRRERPHVILSTGAGLAVPIALVGRVVWGCEIVYVESLSRIVSPSLTARIMYYLADDFFFQWRPLAKFFRRGKLGGPLL